MTTTLPSGPAWPFDHVGVVVRSLNKGRRHFMGALGIYEWTEPLDDPVNGVHLQFGRDASGTVYELLAPLDDTSPVAGALKGRKNLLNHIAYRVPDLARAAGKLREERCLPTGDPRPAIAFGGALI
ncbi:MAG: glyoxalase, partial [Hyphomicrobiales bacterium]